jgi:hypothetical protein
MPAIDGAALRAWRRSRGWDVPEMARQLRRTARDVGQVVAAHNGLVRMVYAWERGDHQITERYELLYAAALEVIPEHLRHGPGRPTGRAAAYVHDLTPVSAQRESVGSVLLPDSLAGDQEDESPVQRRTFIGLTGASVFGSMLARVPSAGVGALASALTDLGTVTQQEPPDDGGTLAAAVDAARSQYQACQYAQLTESLPGLIRRLNVSCATLEGDARDRAHALSADAHHVAAGLLLKRGDQGLASLAADRSMRAALASGDPVAVASSARIITHALMSGGHLATAVATAASYASRLGRDMPPRTPDLLSVYGALLLRGAIAAAQDDNRATAHELLAEAEDAARRLGTDANHRWTAFGPVNATLHRINIAVTLGDAGTAIDLARGVDLDAIEVTERKATLLIDTARAFIQRDRHENAYLALRAAHDTAPQEVTGRAFMRALVRDLASSAPATVRREAAQFAASIGVTQ